MQKSSNDNGCAAAVTAILLVFAMPGICCTVMYATGSAGMVPFVALATVVIAPFAIPLMIELIRAVMHATKDQPHDLLRDAQRDQTRQEHQVRSQAARDARQAPEAIGQAGVLGAVSVGTLPWCYPPGRRQRSWLLAPPIAELARHGVVIGGSGSGKTITLLRLAYLAARVYGYRVWFIDAKGDKETATRFVALMCQIGRDTRLFPRLTCDGWKGDANAILNRLMAVETFTEPYFKAVCKRILSAVCTDPKAGPPRSSVELLERLAALDPAELRLTRADISGVELRYHAFFSTLDGKLDGGWSWEEAQAGYILLDGLSLKEEASSLGRFFIEDFAHYATSRKQPGRDLLIIDEYSAIAPGGADAANLVERLRSYGCMVVLSSQSYAGLGEIQDAERILDAANWLLVHRTANPERLTRRAGTRQQIRETYQFGTRGLDDQGSVQMEEKPQIHPDQARRLETGEALLISQGRFVQAFITPIQPAPDWLRRTHTWIETRPAPGGAAQKAKEPPEDQALPPPQTLP